MSRSASSNRQLPEIASIRAVVLQLVLRHFSQQPNKMQRLMETNGLNAALIQDPYAPIPLTCYLGLLEDAARAAGDPLLGARLGHAIRPGDLGPVGLRVAQAGTIGQGLAALARFTSALQSTTASALHARGDMLIWSYRIEAKPALARRQDSEFTLACTCGLIRNGFDPHWRPAEIHFEHPAAGRRAALEKLFGARVLFGQAANRILMQASEATVPRRQEDRDLISLIERHLSDLVAVGGEATTMAGRVSSLIRFYLGVRPTNLDTISTALKIPPRSLQRCLAAEGVSIRDLVKRHRMELAATLLSQGGMSIEAIAIALGYADSTAFWRARKDWARSA